MEFEIRSVIAGFLGALVILGVLVYVVGISQITTVFTQIDPRVILFVCVIGLFWLAAWGLALHRVLKALSVRTTYRRSLSLYAASAFANNVTPFGQAGGEPFSALLISRATESAYETGLVAIASVDALNFVPSILLALVGLTYYIVRYAAGKDIRIVFSVVVALAVGVPIIGFIAWRHRDTLEERIGSPLHHAWSAVASRVPGLDAPAEHAVRDRLDSFFRSVEVLADRPRNLAIALGFSACGWLVMCLALYLSLWALTSMSGVDIAVVFIVVPVAMIASVAPLPGGAGGVEAVLVLLLIPTTGISAATAASAALLYRVGVYWFPTLIGGLATAYLETTTSEN